MTVLYGRRGMATLATILTLALTACGGGGAGGGGTSIVPAPPNSPSKPASSTPAEQQQAVTSAAAQQARVQAWETKYVGSSQMPSGFRKRASQHYKAALRAMTSTPSPSPSPSPSSSASPSPSPSATPSSAPCNGNQGTSVTQNTDGSVTVNEIGYYDDACSALEYQSVTTISAPDSSGKMTTSGNETDYNTDGKTVVEYDVIAGVIYNANYGTGDISMTITRYNSAADAAANKTPINTDYFASVDTSPNSESDGAASIQADPQFPGGQLGSVSTYTTTYTGGLFQTNQTIAVTGTNTNYKDESGHLVIATNPLPAGQYKWAINGGRVISTTTETENSTTDTTGGLLTYTDTVVDSVDDMTVTITGNIGGTQYKGVIKQTSTNTVLATFVVDGDGSGTITFANGTTQPVVSWCWD